MPNFEKYIKKLKEDNEKLVEDLEFFAQVYNNKWVEEVDKEEVKEDIKNIRKTLNELKIQINNIIIIHKR